MRNDLGMRRKIALSIAQGLFVAPIITTLSMRVLQTWGWTKDVEVLRGREVGLISVR